MRTLALIQARVGSSRLPGKVLAEVNNRPLLWYVVRRTQLALVDDVVVAIPDTVEDLAIAKQCDAWKVPYAVGPEQDVLTRFLSIAQAREPLPDVVVRITADCPLIDPEIIDAVVRLLQKRVRGPHFVADPSAVYASNVFPIRTFPDGLDVEAFPLSTLQLLDELATTPADREHVTSFIHTHARLFLTFSGGSLRTMRLNQDLSEARWTVDTAEDLDFVRAVYASCPWDATMAQIIDRGRRRVVLTGGRTH